MMSKDFDKWFKSRSPRGVYGPYEHQYDAYYRLREGDVYVEAGAYWCRFGRKASREVGSTGKVILIEPDPVNVKVIERVIREKGLRNVTVVDKAVWSEKRKMPFSVRGNQSGHRLLVIRKGSAPIWRRETFPKNEDIIEVKADTVDNILTGLSVDHVDLFASDVENAEVQMLRGMEKYLSGNRVKNLAVAAYHRHPGGNYDEVMSVLRNFDYECVRGEGELRGVVYGWC